MHFDVFSVRSERGERWTLAACGLVLVLAGCGGSDPDPTMAQRSDIALGSFSSGPTPFIRYLPISGQSLKNVVSFRYIIGPKAGAVSLPVNVSYTPAALASRGYHSAGASSATLPVFGLYAGRANRVDVQVQFSDSSMQIFPVTVTTPAYVDTSGVFGRPNIVQKRASSQAGDINYFFLKTFAPGPVVIDTDAEIRWVPPVPVNAYSSIYADQGFLAGAQDSLALNRVELDGRMSSATLNPASYYDNFHHNIELGKQGFLGELDGTSGGVRILESVIVDFDRSGKVLKAWDFVDIVRAHMRAGGDDPDLFVRPGVDWFHSNSSIYDARDDSLIVSAREDFVIKVDYSTGAIKWILGDPTKYWYTFPSLRAKALTLDAGGLYPIGQHALSITSDGRLMMFNNGFASTNQPVGAPIGENRTYSAVSAYDIDPIKMSAREAWRFDYNKSILSEICSSAYLTSGGSMLIDYAAAAKRTRARIVGLDPNRNVAFDFEYTTTGPCRDGWNAEPIGLENMVFK